MSTASSRSGLWFMGSTWLNWSLVSGFLLAEHMENGFDSFWRIRSDAHRIPIRDLIGISLYNLQLTVNCFWYIVCLMDKQSPQHKFTASQLRDAAKLDRVTYDQWKARSIITTSHPVFGSGKPQLYSA